MIQQIRYPAGLNPSAGGRPEFRENLRATGLNTEQRGPQYVISPSRITMSAIDPTLDPAFAGCENETQLSIFLAKSAASWALRGLVAGLAIGVAGSAVAGYFFGRRR